ncbi:hypothetical protein RUM43_005062 [Polyplax serrata]|uniref:Uncharacterized protein n=1 Tax=Polyplax serrata TaxID=468196 RepID=A0AAN8SDW4_POLSC
MSFVEELGSKVTSSMQQSDYNGDSSSHLDESENALNMMSSSFRGPYFDTAVSKNVTALVGKTAYLNCRVRNLGNKTSFVAQYLSKRN